LLSLDTTRFGNLKIIMKTPLLRLLFAVSYFSLPCIAQNPSQAAVALPSPTPAQQSVISAGPTLSRIRAANTLNCGVDFEEAEYSNSDSHGNHSAFDLELCKAIAVAVLGSHAVTKIVSYRDEADALTGLQSGAIAVLATGSINYNNTANHHFGFSRPALYDYQGFIVEKASNIHSTADLANKKVCFLLGGEGEIEIHAYMDRQKIKWLPFPFSEEGEMEAALITHNCDTISADVTQLAYERIAFRNMASSYEILPDVVAKDPLAPTYRLDDPQWANIVNWVVNALILAEESGIKRANLPEMKHSEDPAIMRLLGTQHGWGQYLGLDDAWAARVIEAVGNYGELYDRTLGPPSVMRLPRGVNSLWSHGGLLYADPIR
jgi:general L-amino acid transport system substrate-binding protein